jgi:hypothetical protein
MLENEKRRLKEERRKKRGLLDGIDVCGEVLNDLIGAIYIGAFLMLIISVAKMIETGNFSYGAAVIPFAAIIFGLMGWNEF